MLVDNKSVYLSNWVEKNVISIKDLVKMMEVTSNSKNFLKNLHARQEISVNKDIRLARGKFELTNQDSAGGKTSSVLTSS